MRRLMLLAAMALLLVGVPAWGQRGGGHASGGAAHMNGAVRGAPMSSGFHGVARGQYVSSYHGGGYRNCPGCSRYSRYPYRYPYYRLRFGYPYYGYGYGYAGYYYPYWWWDDSSDSQADSYDAQGYLTSQIDDLNQQLQQLRQQQDQQAYYRAEQPRPPAQPSAPASTARTPAESRKDLPTILVYRDQHIQEVQNYAILGKNLVVIADGRSTKIPLENLDLAATSKLNDERGVDFQLPR